MKTKQFDGTIAKTVAECIKAGCEELWAAEYYYFADRDDAVYPIEHYQSAQRDFDRMVGNIKAGGVTPTLQRFEAIRVECERPVPYGC